MVTLYLSQLGLTVFVRVVFPHASVGALDLRLCAPRQPLAGAQGPEHEEAHRSGPDFIIREMLKFTSGLGCFGFGYQASR